MVLHQNIFSSKIVEYGLTKISLPQTGTATFLFRGEKWNTLSSSEKNSWIFPHVQNKYFCTSFKIALKDVFLTTNPTKQKH